MESLNCNAPSFDNRETCTETVPSSCVPYTGYISDTIRESLPCRPNVNDILKKLQQLIDTLNTGIGDNTGLEGCLSLDSIPFSQSEFNAAVVQELCAVKALLTEASVAINPATILIPVDLLCLLDPTCTPQATYTLTDVITKLVVNYCNLLARVQTIETTINI